MLDLLAEIDAQLDPSKALVRRTAAQYISGL